MLYVIKSFFSQMFTMKNGDKFVKYQLIFDISLNKWWDDRYLN